MVAQTMVELLKSYGITPSRSRPRVSNDNAYAESAFATAKSSPDYPESFTSLEGAQVWGQKFIQWARTRPHSGIQYLTPMQRRSGNEDEILAHRDAVFADAKSKHPERWNNRNTRDWSLSKEVYLNPTKEMREKEELRKKARNKERQTAVTKKNNPEKG